MFKKQAYRTIILYSQTAPSKVIRELDSASGNMTETVRKSVSSVLNQVALELKQTGVEQQKPAVNALNQVVKTANESVYAMRSEMSRYTWKSAIYLVLTIFFVMACCMTALTWFMNDGYSRISEMQRMEAIWQKKAPLADISTCDGKPCVKVDTRTTYGDKGDKENTWMIIKK